MTTYVLPLSDPAAALETVGGKGMSLAKMARAGLPVPGGFHITTGAYRRFVEANGIQPRILAALEGADPGDLPALERISSQITQYFSGGTIPPEITGEAAAAYARLSAAPGVTPVIPVAVRSSATAEDLPGASFAGQQETYLNICGAEAVLAAVRQCWASLWTARAIAYRARQGIAPDSVALAVVVQALVFADASGVLFTINPVSGERGEQMITATWGLGEALVGGLVTPDTLTVAKSTGQVTRRETSVKQVMTVRTETGTREQPVPKHLQKAPVLSDAQASALAALGARIEQLYGAPMDIEWTLANGQFAIVQARPVTTLREAPLSEPAEPPFQWVRSNPKAVMGRASMAEFLPEPASPLFATLAVPLAQVESQKLMDGIYGHSDNDTYLMELINGYLYIGMVLTPRMIWKAIFASGRQTVGMVKTGHARWLAAQDRLSAVAAKWQQQDPTAIPAPALMAGARELFRETAEYFTVGQTGAIPVAPMSEMILTRFYKSLIKTRRDPDASAFMLGFDTVPLRAEKSLYDLAQWVKEQPELAEAILREPAEAVRAALQADPVPAPYAGEFAERFAAHLAQFGHTIYDLDFAKPVPADNSAPLIEAMKTYLAGKGADPSERQRAQAARREQAEQAILKRLDPLRRKWFASILHWAQRASPDRENCIADIGLGYPALRALLGELGRRLAAAGAIAQPDDIYWLEAQEADALAEALETGAPVTDHAAQVEQRKALWQRESRATPPVGLPEKSWMSKLMAHDNPEGSTLKGYAASAGKVTARACLLHGPEDFASMQPGDVIVAVTTTPAWTPLFAMASAVVTDIGGPLSHSSIVAREYGIPAVMATGVATRRIRHGQMITVDGTAGVVTLLEQAQ